MPAQSVHYLSMGVSTINKVRVHELSKELGISPKELLHFLNDLGANVRNHMSTIEDKFVEQARQAFPNQKQPRFSQINNTKPTAKVGPVSGIKQTSPPEAGSKQSKPVSHKSELTSKSGAKKEHLTSKRVEESPKTKRTVSPRPQAKSETKPEVSPKTVRPKKTEVNIKARSSQRGAGQTKSENKSVQKPHNQTNQKQSNNKQRARSGPGAARGPVARPTGKRQNSRGFQRKNVKPVKPKGPITNVKSVKLPPSMTVKEFSQLIEVAASDVIKKLMGLGLLANINQEIDLDTMILLAEGYKISASAAPT